MLLLGSSWRIGQLDSVARSSIDLQFSTVHSSRVAPRLHSALLPLLWSIRQCRPANFSPASIRPQCPLAAASSNRTGQLDEPQLLLGNSSPTCSLPRSSNRQCYSSCSQKHKSPTPPLLKPLQHQLDRFAISPPEKLAPCDPLICCAFVCSPQPAVVSLVNLTTHTASTENLTANNLANFLHPLRTNCWNFTKRKSESNSIDTTHCSCSQPALSQTSTLAHTLATLLARSCQLDQFAREKRRKTKVKHDLHPRRLLGLTSPMHVHTCMCMYVDCPFDPPLPVD